MRKETFLDSARVFERQRIGFIERLASKNDEDIKWIKTTMRKGVDEEYKSYQYAVVIYLNAMINGSKKISKLVKHMCGEELFTKLISAGLKEI